MAAAIGDLMKITAVTLTGSNQALALEKNLRTLVLHADGGEAEIRLADDASAPWKIPSGGKEAWDNPSIGGRVLYVQGAGTLRVLQFRGLMS